MEDKKSNAMRKAVIGLIGTMLTVCSGLTGAGISAAVTIYQIERGRQQVALAALSRDQTLTVDTRQIAISEEEATQLDPGNYVVPDLGFALAQPRAGWSQMEEMTYHDLFLEEEALSPLILFYSWVGSAWDDQPVRRIRYGEPVQVQYQEKTTENGAVVDLEMLRSLTGSDTLPHYSQITILAVDKEVAADYTLAGIALTWGAIHRGGVNRIVASEGSQYILMQATWQMQNVRIDGRETDLSIERWALFAEGAQRYYAVEINYVPGADQPVRVWEDVQAYMDSFRVIR